MSRTLITPAAYSIALSLCKGGYQRSLVAGCSSWSGSDLQGNAARYGGRYRSSRESLLEAFRKAGLRAVVSRIGYRSEIVATIVTRAEARGIKGTIPGGDPRIEGLALEARIERIEKRIAAAERKRARERATDEAFLATLAA